MPANYPGHVGQRLGVQTYATFKAATKANTDTEGAGAVLKGRGPSMSLVDAGLQAWDKAVPTTDGARKVKILREIVKSTAWWLNQKGAQQGSALRQRRRGAVHQLLQQALAALGQFDPAEAAFATRKAQAIIDGLVVATSVRTARLTDTVKDVGGFSATGGRGAALSPGYHNERAHYVASGGKAAGETSTPAGGYAKNVHDSSPGGAQAAFATLGLDAYADLVRTATAVDHTAYLPKADRMEYLLIEAGGALRRPGGAQGYDTDRRYWNDPRPMRADMWAMDRYGNLFVKDSEPLNGMSYFNHSSFNAGNEVICAGMIVINNGILASIDNASGHYKPDAASLRQAIEVLRDGYGILVFANMIRVGMMQPDESLVHVDAHAFLTTQPAGWAALPAWDATRNQVLQLAPN